MIWAVIVILLILLFFIGGLIWMLIAEDDVAAQDPRRLVTPRHVALTPSKSRPTPLSTPAVGVETRERMPAIANVLFSSDESTRRCPSCERTFGPQIAICPFDSTPLASVVVEHADVPSEKRRQCPECERTFASGAKYCYVHGSNLRREHHALSVFWACYSCGAEGNGAHGSCGCDEPNYVAIDPLDETPAMPPLPMSRCVCCSKLHPQSVSVCPDDGHQTLPIWDLKIHENPPTGIGPRRNVCHECGTTFSTAAKYCSLDGSKLHALN